MQDSIKNGQAEEIANYIYGSEDGENMTYQFNTVDVSKLEFDRLKKQLDEEIGGEKFINIVYYNLHKLDYAVGAYRERINLEKFASIYHYYLVGY